MASGNTTPDAKRARPHLNVYTGLLAIAVLLCVFGATVVAMMNMDATGQGPFDIAAGR
jgi:hypothetical protein